MNYAHKNLLLVHVDKTDVMIHNIFSGKNEEMISPVFNRLNESTNMRQREYCLLHLLLPDYIFKCLQIIGKKRTCLA